MMQYVRRHASRLALVASAMLLAACSDLATTPDSLAGALFNKKGGGTPSPSTATWTGNGSSWDGEQFIITDSRCDESEGEPYLYWVLTAGGNASIDAATITIDGESAPMDRVSKGAFKYTHTFEGEFVAPVEVTASFSGSKSANLVLSHGCTGGSTPDVASFKFTNPPESGLLVYWKAGDGCTYGTGGTPWQVASSFQSHDHSQFQPVCTTPADGGFVNMIFSLPVGVTVTLDKGQACTSDEPNVDPNIQWYCLITEPETSIRLVTGLTIQFRPVNSYQEVYYCKDGAEESVCVDGLVTTTLNWSTFNTSGGVLQQYNIPLATLESENTSGYFNITVRAPATVPAGSKIGPGVGITCLQRSGPTKVGTETGNISDDITGAGIVDGTQWYEYWYTACSLDTGVTHAYFYAYTGTLP